MKHIQNFRVNDNLTIGKNYSLLKLTPANGEALPETIPGQFVQVRIDGSKNTFLRRPISICFIDEAAAELWLLVRKAGEGTTILTESKEGETVNLILPLGNGFHIPETDGARCLLVGGGVGVAPLLQLGAVLKSRGYSPEFLLGARSEADLLLVDEFEKFGDVHISTDDGSHGHHGVVTTHPTIFEDFDVIYCCGPSPMMKGVAACARKSHTECYVSLENMMACGLGACLCCVEKTVKGNVCVCTEGPVFNINELTW